MTNNKSNLITAVILLLVYALFLAFFLIKYKITVLNRPEQHERVEVIRKRIKENDSDGYVYYDYLVTFRFPDGSGKEFDVGSDKREFYDSLHEGDTGMLTYKERENIEKHNKKENNRWKDRRFYKLRKGS